MKIFVTGAAGFIGGSIATGLLKAGHQITGLVRSAEQARALEPPASARWTIAIC